VLVYEGGFLARPTGRLKAFVRYGTLFRYPFTDEQASTYMPPFGFNDALEAETGANIELGSSVRLKEGLSFDVVLYSLSMEKEIGFDPVTFTNVNLHSTRRLGADLRLSAKPFPFLSIGGTFGFVSARFSSGPDAGKRVPLVPEQSGTLDIALRPFAGFETGATAEFRGSFFQGGDAANVRTPVPGFAIFGLSASYRFELGRTKFRLTGRVDNIFDLPYATQVYHSAWSGSSAWYPEQGRSIGINLAVVR
jgi:iron complex outermembrane recepter protein